MQRKFIAGAWRDCTFTEERDTGGMFNATVGVWVEGNKYTAFVSDWGGGMKSPAYDTEQEAIRAIERLMGRYY